jgi:GNAT superfamily N-acetyltransferase
MTQSRDILPPSAPSIKGLSFRHYEGDQDLPIVVDVPNRSMTADGDAFAITMNDARSEYGHPLNFDPSKDVMIAELEGKPIGVSSVRWKQKPEGVRLYEHHAHLVPEARMPGLRQSMFLWGEQRLREIAAGHDTPDRKELEVWTKAEMNDWRRLVVANGYRDAWHLFEMRRPNLDNIPDHRLPAGIELRPVTRDNFRAVFMGAHEAFLDERGYTEERWGEEAYERTLANPELRLDLWQVAWDGDQVVGGVVVVISEQENAAMKRKRGWTEAVFVRRPWRKKGVARALLSSALRVVKEIDMEEAALGVDTDNPSGALKIYKDMGYVADFEFIFARKPLV